MPYDAIDPTRLEVFPLAGRRSYIQIEQEAARTDAAPPDPGPLAPQLDALAACIKAARSRNASVMLTYGAHLVKNGAGPLLNALIQEGWLTHLATQGAGVIHDWEFAFLGRSSESVRDNAPAGRFGSWDETGKWINLAVIAGAAEGLGLGEAVGRLIVDDGLTLPAPAALMELVRAEPAHPLAGARADLLWTMQRFGLAPGRHEVPHPYKRFSTLACAFQHRVPLTVHPGIGYDIIVNHPVFHGGAIGRASGSDARVFAQGVMNLSGGVYLSVGSAIMSPQVFEKAFSAANNLRLRDGRPTIDGHTIAIVDLQDGGGWDWSRGEPPKENPAYYLRFCKTFHRMGGRLDYLCGDNRLVLANLLARLRAR